MKTKYNIHWAIEHPTKLPIRTVGSCEWKSGWRSHGSNPIWLSANAAITEIRTCNQVSPAPYTVHTQNIWYISCVRVLLLLSAIICQELSSNYSLQLALLTFIIASWENIWIRNVIAVFVLLVIQTMGWFTWSRSWDFINESFEAAEPV